MSVAAAPFTPDELSLRRPVWEGLSELYLDTDTRPDLPALAQTLAGSGLSVPELEAVWQGEITPLLHSNLLAVVGVWAGFDLDWLEAQIVARRARQIRPTRLGRWWRSEMEGYFQTALALRADLLALPKAQWPERVADWHWLARVYFWPELPLLGAVPDTPDLAALFTALEPHLRPLLTGKEHADRHRLHALKLIGDHT